MDQPPQNGFPQQPAQPWIAAEPPRPHRKSHPLLWALLFLLVIGFFGMVLLGGLVAAVGSLAGLGADGDEIRIQERFVSHNRMAADKVAILSIEGTILGGEGVVKRQIDHARKDIDNGTLKALVVRVNSPGGTITGSDYILHHLRQLVRDTDVPIVVSMGGIAASGGYYVSMCVGQRPDTIFAEPTTWTGSIGVIIPHYNVAGLMEKWGIQEDPVASDPLKTMGSIARKMTDQERALFQGLVDEGFARFKNVIRQGRPKFEKDPAALVRLATGQFFRAQQALENGLIDRSGFLEDAVDQAILLAKLNKANVKVVKYKPEPRLADLLFGQSVFGPHRRSSTDLAALLESASPRAYYLCTWLPVVK